MIKNDEKTVETTQVSKINIEEPQKYASDIIWFSIAQLFVALILGVITMPALTKSYPSASYGLWVLVTVTVELISPLLSLQLGLAAVRYLSGIDDKVKKRRALGAMLTAILIFTVIVSIGTIIFLEPISILLFASPQYTNFVILIMLWTFVNSIFNFFISYLRMGGKIKGISIIQVTMTIMKMILIVGLASIVSKLELIVISMIVLQTIYALMIFIMIIREIGITPLNFTGLKTYLFFSLPQMPGIILLWLMSLGDRTFITHFLGLSEAGIYSSSNILAGLTSIFYAPIAFVLLPMISRLWEQKRKEDVKAYLEYSLRFFLTMAIPGAIGIALLSQALLKLLTTSEFLVGAELVLLVAIGAVFLGIYQICMNLVLLGKHAKLIPIIVGIAAAVSVIMNLILIPRIGILGAGFSNFSAYGVLAIITIIWGRKTLHFSINYRYLIKVIVSSLFMAIALYFLNVNSIWGILLALVVGSIVYCLGLFILKAFSHDDISLGRRIISGMIPGYTKNK